MMKGSRMVVGNFAANMMKNVSLRDTMSGMSSDPSHNAAKITEKATVQGRKGTTRKSKGVGTVMRN